MKTFERDSSLDLIKWIALFTMIIDHTWFVLPNEIQENLSSMRIIGRLAYPLFCLAIAANVVRQPISCPVGLKYLSGILLFAILSQWPYSRYFDNGHLNILFVIALGLVIAQAMHHRTPGLILCGILALLITIALRPVLSYGVAGVLLPTALVIALQARKLEIKIVSWSLSALLAAIANLGSSILLLHDLPPMDHAVITAAALAPLLGLTLLQIQVRPLRSVKGWLYPLYPIHLLLLSSLSIAF
ncbi:TraX family protein [Pseudomonas viridiflava]|uniref:TraX family protein n=1 Tax=Pseudomonas viridiflava TaxID=33069 RepID=UPI002EA6E5B3|nr:TraX family protein [Pseudomonas viridiflava]